VNRRLGIWFRPDRCALVSFLNFIDSLYEVSIYPTRSSYKKPTRSRLLSPSTKLVYVSHAVNIGVTNPKEPLPTRESRSLEERVLQDRLHTTQGLDDIRPIRVQVPELAVVALARPPEGVGLHVLVDLELCPSTETLVEAECAAVLLKQRVYPGQSVKVVSICIHRSSGVWPTLDPNYLQGPLG
jgi:hypothetical protein